MSIVLRAWVSPEKVPIALDYTMRGLKQQITTYNNNIPFKIHSAPPFFLLNAFTLSSQLTDKLIVDFKLRFLQKEQNKMKRNTIFKIIAAVVLIGAIVGLGAFAYRAGMSQGIASGMEFDPQQFEGGKFPMTPHMGYGYRGFHPGGFLIPFFLILLVFGAIRSLFWRGPRRWHHMHGPRGMYKGAGYGCWEAGVPPMFDEWHRQAHAQGSEANPESPDTEEAIPE
jgi:hypothetical protein